MREGESERVREGKRERGREGEREREAERQAGRKFREPTRYVTYTAETERAHAPPLLVTLGLGSTQTRLRV